MTNIDEVPVMPEILSGRRRLTLLVALIAAILMHGLALGGLIRFSSRSDASKPLAALDLHWISMIEPSEPPEPLERAVTQRIQIEPGDGLAAVSVMEPNQEPIREPVDPGPVNLEVAPAESHSEPVLEAVTAPVALSAAAPMAAIGPVASPDPDPRAESSHHGESIPHSEVPQRVQAALPEANRRAFDVYLGDFSLGQRVAAIDYLFESNGGHYQLRTEGRATGVMAMFYGGLLTQDSRGRVGLEGFMPERYAERRGERAARVVSFDRTTGLAVSDDGSTQPLPAGVQDQLSAIWQLALIARMTPEQLAHGQELQWPIARGRRVHSMRIVSLGEENLHPGHRAQVRTLHLVLTSVTIPDDGRLDVWLATDEAMQPIRMKMASAQGLVLDQIFRFPKPH